MIPIAVFVIVWLIFVGIFIVISILSIWQMLKFGVAGRETRWSTYLFIGLTLLIIILTLIFLSQVDLQQTLNINVFLEGIFPAITV
ncbi:MAG: hypothetical protein ACOYUZ_04540 [Patescibacteria group bacterium]